MAEGAEKPERGVQMGLLFSYLSVGVSEEGG